MLRIDGKVSAVWEKPWATDATKKNHYFQVEDNYPSGKKFLMEINGNGVKVGDKIDCAVMQKIIAMKDKNDNFNGEFFVIYTKISPSTENKKVPL